MVVTVYVPPVFSYKPCETRGPALRALCHGHQRVFISTLEWSATLQNLAGFVLGGLASAVLERLVAAPERTPSSSLDR